MALVLLDRKFNELTCLQVKLRCNIHIVPGMFNVTTECIHSASLIITTYTDDAINNMAY